MKPLTILTVLLVLSGCDTPVHPSEPDDRKGYLAGCDTGKWRAGDWTRRYNKDEESYQLSHDYRKAWDEGFFTCLRRLKGVDQ